MALEEACPGTAWAEPPIGNQRKAAARAARNTDLTFISSLHWAGALWPPRVSGMAQVGPRWQPCWRPRRNRAQSVQPQSKCLMSSLLRSLGGAMALSRSSATRLPSSTWRVMLPSVQCKAMLPNYQHTSAAARWNVHDREEHT